LAGAAWNGIGAEEIVAAAVNCGIGRTIVLDLAQVGTARGVGTVALCRALSKRWPALELIAGGGVRGPQDVAELAAAGCAGALVASALHDGTLRDPANA
jgi:phosphoribosylformimino-5-aminoimidazole carboxamide ribotide isomerase